MIITEETIVRYILGEASLEETIAVGIAAQNDPELEERLLVARRVQRKMEVKEREELQLERMAAKSEDNRCVVRCESYLLEQKFPSYGDKTLWTVLQEEQAFEDGLRDSEWQTGKGTALYNIGRILEENGLSTTRRHLCSLDDLKDALVNEEGVIAVVNEEILLGEEGDGNPNHAVCVLEVKQDEVVLYNPSIGRESSYSIEVFQRAWETSKRYAVFANTPERKRYSPNVHHLLDDVELEDSLEELQEALSEFAHDVWAERKIKNGYIYGPETNSDESRGPLTNQCLKPYSELPEDIKDYDREMSTLTLKLVKKLGYLLDKESDYICPDCGQRIRMEWNYCCECGRPLEISDFKRKRNA